MLETSHRGQVFFLILIAVHRATVEKPFGRADPVQAEKHKSLKLTAGLIRFSTFTDRVVPLNVFKMI